MVDPWPPSPFVRVLAPGRSLVVEYVLQPKVRLISVTFPPPTALLGPVEEFVRVSCPCAVVDDIESIPCRRLQPRRPLLYMELLFWTRMASIGQLRLFES